MRLEAFLAKKRANAVSSTSSPESESGGQSLEAPGKPPNQTAPERDGDKPTHNQHRQSGQRGREKIKEIKMSVQKCLGDSVWDDFRRRQEGNKKRNWKDNIKLSRRC